MNANGQPRRRFSTPAVEPTSLTEICRRYYATALALSKAMGLPLTETFLREHRESITTCFIQAGMEGIRLPPAVQLPPLSVETTVVTPDERETTVVTMDETVSTMVDEDAPDVAPPPDPAPTPEVVPAGLPCAGQLVTQLKPAQLAMLIARAANLVHEQGEAWVSLLAALQIERAARLERGKRRQGEG